METVMAAVLTAVAGFVAWVTYRVGNGTDRRRR